MSENKTTTRDHQPNGELSGGDSWGASPRRLRPRHCWRRDRARPPRSRGRPAPAGAQDQVGLDRLRRPRGLARQTCSESTAGTSSMPWPTTSRTWSTRAARPSACEKSRRFTGLSGYKKILDCGVEALGILDVPCFFPEQATAAVAAGCHVYIAKPVAVDVPGCLAIEAAGRLATQKKRCFLVDYQLPTDPVNIEVVQRIWDGGLGRLRAVTTIGQGGGSQSTSRSAQGQDDREPPARAGLVQRHPAGRRPASSTTTSTSSTPRSGPFAAAPSPPSAIRGSAAPNPTATAQDLAFITYECPDGAAVEPPRPSFCPTTANETLTCNLHGQLASARIGYEGKSFLRGGPKHFGGGNVENLYEQGPSATSPRSIRPSSSSASTIPRSSAPSTAR